MSSPKSSKTSNKQAVTFEQEQKESDDNTNKYEWSAMSILIWFCIFASLLFPIPQYFFIYDGSNWKPRDWFIAFSITFGAAWVYLLIETVTKIYANEKKMMDYNEALQRFCIQVTFIYLFVLFANVLWLNKHYGLISSTNKVNYLAGENGKTPDCPGKTDEGYLDFRAVSIITIIMMNNLFIRSCAFYTEFKNRNTREPTSNVANSQTGAEMAYTGYFICSILMYVLLAIYLLIFFVHSFENDAPLRLQGMFVLYVFIVGIFIVRLFFYYNIPPTAASSFTFSCNLSNRYKVRQEGARLYLIEQLTWGFLVVWDACMYIYYYGVEFDMKDVPRLDRNIIRQEDAWYVFQTHSIVRGAQLVEFTVMAVLVFIVFKTSRVEVSSVSRKEPSNTTPPNVSRNLLFLWIFVSWAAVLIMLSFNLSSAMGYSWLAIAFERYYISVLCIGVAIGIIAVVVVRYCAKNYKDAKSTIAAMSWIVYVERITYAIPVLLVSLFITLSVPLFKYSDLGRESMRELLNPPLITPVYSVSYYWVNTYLSTLIMLFPILFIMIESNTLTILRRIKEDKEIKKQLITKNAGSSGSKRNTDDDNDSG